jgi:uncharacterized membrane protein YobD (UPF0266 family)
VIVGQVVFDFSVLTRVRVRGLHLQDRGSDGNVFVNIVSLVIWNYKLNKSKYLWVWLPKTVLKLLSFEFLNFSIPRHWWNWLFGKDWITWQFKFGSIVVHIWDSDCQLKKKLRLKIRKY